MAASGTEYARKYLKQNGFRARRAETRGATGLCAPILSPRGAPRV
jgi:hypothetical protein